MTAPIRPEHREAARALIHALASERLNEIGGTVGYYIELTGEQGEINEEAIAAVLASRDATQAAEIARLKAERDEEQSAHNAIGSVLAQAGCETPDGTSLGFARSAAANLAALSAEYAAAVRALDQMNRQFVIANRTGKVVAYEVHGVLSTPRARAVLEQGETT